MESYAKGNPTTVDGLTNRILWFLRISLWSLFTTNMSSGMVFYDYIKTYGLAKAETLHYFIKLASPSGITLGDP